MTTKVSTDRVVWYSDAEEREIERRLNDQGCFRSLLFVPCIPEYCEDDYCIVMDYDGLSEWFDEWSADDEIFHDCTLDEYLPFHIKTGIIGLVKGVAK